MFWKIICCHIIAILWPENTKLMLDDNVWSRNSSCEKKLKWFEWKIYYVTVDCGKNSGMLVIVFHVMGKQLRICTFDVHDMRVINLGYTNILASFFVFFQSKTKKSQYIDLLDLSYAVLLQIVKPRCLAQLTTTISPNSYHVQVYHCTSTVNSIWHYKQDFQCKPLWNKILELISWIDTI